VGRLGRRYQGDPGVGALVLSEFTGAAAELREAVPCNPFDVEGLSYKIEHALGLPASTRRNALTTMARRIRGHDVHQWVSRQLAEIESRGVSPVRAFSA
jgi:trehalose-6-phosphate synthase